MIDIKMFARRRATGGTTAGSAGPAYQPDDSVRRALTADKATFGEQADTALKAGEAARARYADCARDLAEDSPAYDTFLRKDKEDTAKELINFLKGITIGDIKISYDETTSALALTRVSGGGRTTGLYATGGLTAYGVEATQGGGGGGGGGTSYERLDRWSDYTTAKAAAVLSAFLGNDLNERLKRVEARALTSVDWSIIKNKPAAMPASDVPAWAKAATKPTYAWNEIAQRPTKISELTNDANYITAAANVATATRLQTARTLWGQQFDGTGNVDGVLTVKHAGTAGIFLTSTSDESSFSCECTGSRRWVFGGYPTRFFLWNSAAKHVLSVLNNGNVVIGDTELNSPYKLNVKGSVRIGEKLCIAGMENSDITSVRNANGAIKNITIANAAVRNALDFCWYDTHYQIGNIRGGGANSIGFGITKDNSTLIARFHENGSQIYGNLTVDGFLSLANNTGLSLKDKEGANQRALFISNSNTVYFGCNDRPLYTIFTGSELQFNIYNSGWQSALVISRDKSAQFYGNISAMGGVTAYTTSDRRLKENIKQVDSMKIIRSLGGTWQFDYKDTGKHGIGFIAQSVRGSMLKSMVYADDNGYLKLNYLDTRLIALALGAAVQVDDKVERLKKRIRELEKEVELLKHN
ncbi:tail fiber domain-containing protein [Segatella maculosa]|uniref:tail fiber domain-containing protein n=1 Tax=Segatella maculosa TaxID=439703 RepID=UPI0024924EFD|nr:tail fiber domain-containing protein [Segatella maculosa]